MTVAILIYLVISLARLNLLFFPLILPEFQIFLISVIIILVSGGGFVFISQLLTKKVSEKILICLGLLIIVISSLLFSIFPYIFIYYLSLVLTGFGTILF